MAHQVNSLLIHMIYCLCSVAGGTIGSIVWKQGLVVSLLWLGANVLLIVLMILGILEILGRCGNAMNIMNDLRLKYSGFHLTFSLKPSETNPWAIFEVQFRANCESETLLGCYAYSILFIVYH